MRMNIAGCITLTTELNQALEPTTLSVTFRAPRYRWGKGVEASFVISRQNELQK